MKIADRETRQVVDAAVQRGWTWSLTRGGHVRLQHPSGAVVFTSSTPSEFRALKNLKAQIRRAERRAS